MVEKLGVSVSKDLKGKQTSTQRGKKKKVLSVTWKDRERASWIGEQTEVEDFVMTGKNKKGTYESHNILYIFEIIRNV